MKKLFSLLMVLALGLSLFLPAALAEEADAASAATPYYYEDSSMDKAALAIAINSQAGGCTVATVDEDGAARIGIFVPGSYDEDYIVFGLADNPSKTNILRNKEAMICYYIYHPEAEDRNERNSGARVHAVLEEDQAKIDEIAELIGEKYDPAMHVILRIEEIIPLG